MKGESSRLGWANARIFFLFLFPSDVFFLSFSPKASTGKCYPFIIIYNNYMHHVMLSCRASPPRPRDSHKSSLFLCDLVNCSDVRWWRWARTARLIFQHKARAVSFGPTNYEKCLHRSEWVSEWHICISEFPQETRFNASRFDEFKKACVFEWKRISVDMRK